MTTLKELAKKMLAGPKDYVYTITGYADFTTGARSNNIAIAEKRAQSVYDYLVASACPQPSSPTRVPVPTPSRSLAAATSPSPSNSDRGRQIF